MDDNHNEMNWRVENTKNKGGPVFSKGIERDFGLYELFRKLSPDIPSRVLMAKLGGDWHVTSEQRGYETLKKTSDIVKLLEDIVDVRNR